MIRLKKLSAFVLVLCFVLSFGITVYADYSEGYFHYTVNGGSVTITEYFGDETEVRIPSAIAGNPVNSIAAGAFKDAPTVKTVYLPDTVMNTEPGAFSEGINVFFIGSTVETPAPPKTSPTPAIIPPEPAGAPATPIPPGVYVPQITTTEDGAVEEVVIDENGNTVYTVIAPTPTIEAVEDTESVSQAEEAVDQKDEGKPNTSVLLALAALVVILSAIAIYLTVRNKKQTRDNN